MKINKISFLIIFVCLLIMFSSTAMAVQSRAERKYFLSDESYEYEKFIKNETYILETSEFYQEDYDKMIEDNMNGYVNERLELKNGEIINQYYSIKDIYETPQDLVDEGYSEELIELNPINVPEKNSFSIDWDNEVEDFKLIYLTKDEYKNIK